MSKEYDLYLEQHKANVAKAFHWIQENVPGLIVPMSDVDYEHQICMAHDASKSEADEYYAYDAYFYGRNRSYDVVQDFNYAWLRHQNRNPHHWQYFVLLMDDPSEGEIIMDMPYNYVLEMICDWFAFSFQCGNLYEIFNWYDHHKDHIKLSPWTRATVETILFNIRTKLDQMKIEDCVVEVQAQIIDGGLE